MEGPRYLGPEEMRGLLREAFAGDPEKSLLQALVRSMSDPAAPTEAGASEGRALPRLHPLLVTYAILTLMVLAIFLVFTFVQF